MCLVDAVSMSVVSIVVRTTGRAFFLGRALASIAAQNDSRVEVIVVNDGGASDEVEAIVGPARELGLPVRVVHHAASLGRSAAWNAGWRAATGEWLTALDDDDTWESDFLRAVREVIAVHGSGGGVVTQTLEIREVAEGAGWREVARKPFNPELKAVRLTELVLGNLFTNNAFVFPRAVLAEVGEIREDLDVLEDWDFNVRFAARFPVRVVARSLAHYRRRPAGRGEAWANTDIVAHQAAYAAVREGWIREDVRAGRLGLGQLTLLAETRGNLGLRLFNRVGAFLRYFGGRR